MNIIDAQELYDRLVNETRIKTCTGEIRFDFGEVNIKVKQRDVVGNIMQEWLRGWFERKGIAFEENKNTQMPPDFFLVPGNYREGLLEVKAFNYEAAPGFDIADFKAYANELKEKPWMLRADYLIFGYTMSPVGDVSIKGLWLKKVWEITRRMKDWPINLQVKKDVVHKIRPGVWYAAPRHYHIFRSYIDFLSALEETLYECVDTRQYAHTWKTEFLRAWEEYTGERLTLPRWSDIKDTYEVRS